MSNTIYLLNFRHGTVEEIDEAIPPRGFRDESVSSAGPETHAGFVLAALGTPPEQDDRSCRRALR